MRKKIVILGCGAAGVSAAIAARKLDRAVQIVVLEQTKHSVYERGGIPYVIGGAVPTFEALVSFSPHFYELMKIDLHTETKATNIDSCGKEVNVLDKKGKEIRFRYDCLIVATGADSVLIPVPGHELPGVYGVRTLDDGRKILRNCKTVTSAVVIGARLVGLETAVALRQCGLDVTVIELLPQILDGILDIDLAFLVQEELEKAGIHFILGNGISEITGKERVRSVCAGPYALETDMVIMAAGVRGRTELAQQTGVKLGETKLIKVDERLETNIKNVFAAGDCIECVNAITNKPTVSQLGANAMKQGQVAGINAAGGGAVYPKVLGACATRFFNTEIASTGLTETLAEKFGIKCVSSSTVVNARPSFYPEKIPVRIKLVANVNSGKVVGAQIITGREAGPRIDTISMAIMKGATAKDLTLFDHAYSPPVAESPDPISVAAEILNKKFIQVQRL